MGEREVGQGSLVATEGESVLPYQSFQIRARRLRRVILCFCVCMLLGVALPHFLSALLRWQSSMWIRVTDLLSAAAVMGMLLYMMSQIRQLTRIFWAVVIGVGFLFTSQVVRLMVNMQLSGGPLLSPAYSHVYSAIRYLLDGVGLVSFVGGLLYLLVEALLIRRDAHLEQAHLSEEIQERKAAERALRLSEARLRALVDNIPFDFWAMDREFHYVMQNAMSRAHWGDMVGKRPHEVVDDSALVAAWMMQNRSALAGEATEAEYTLPWGKTERSFSSFVAPVLVEGETRGILGVSLDITEQLRARQNLELREGILQAVAHTAEELFEASSWQARMEHVLECLGQAAQADYAHVYQNWHREDGALMASLQYQWFSPALSGVVEQRNSLEESFCVQEVGLGRWAACFERGESIYGVLEDFPKKERAFLSRTQMASVMMAPVFVSGKWWGCIGFDSTNVRHLWSHGEVLALKAAAGILGTAIQRSNTEAALRESENRFRLFFNNINDAVLIEDMDGYFLEVNYQACLFSGYAREKLLTMQHRELVAPEYRMHATQEWKKLLEMGNGVYESACLTHSGELVPVEVSARLIEFEGHPSVFSVVRDISDRKEAERTIEEQRMNMIAASRLSSLGVMASGVAHEINNPLAIISVAVQQLQELQGSDVLSEERVEHLSQTIVRHVERIKRIVRGMCNLSRDGGGEPFERRSVAELVEDALELCRSRFKFKNIRLLTDVIPLEIEVECRGTQISQVLMNLLNNAQDAVVDLPEKWVRLEVEAQEEWVYLRVIDSGAGIPLELQERIEEPFFTTKGVGKGTGLGLSISKAIIESHQGRFYLDTNAANTCFVVALQKSLPHTAARRTA